MSKRRPTNNVARLPRETRYRVYTLILDGLTYDDVRKAMGMSNLHNTSLIACQRSGEFLEYRAATAEYQAKTLKQSIEAAVVRAAPDVSILTETALMEQVQGLISQVEDPRAVKSLTSALRDLSAMKETRKIKALESELSVQKVYFETVLSEKDAEIVRLTEALTVKKETGKRGLSSEARARIEELGEAL